MGAPSSMLLPSSLTHPPVISRHYQTPILGQGMGLMLLGKGENKNGAKGMVPVLQQHIVWLERGLMCMQN